MAYPWHYLFSFGGTTLDGAEIWSNNIRFVGTGTPDEEYDEQARAEGLLNVMSQGFSRTGTASLGYSTANRLQWGKFNRINPDGRYASDSVTNRADLTGLGTPGTGQAGTNVPQVALAVSWGTARQRGTASRGRIYIPMPNVAPGPSGRLSAATTQALATAWATQIDLLNDEVQDLAATRPIAAVVSGVSAAWSPIQTVRVGDVLDTQRSRRSALAENYSSASVPDSE